MKQLTFEEQSKLDNPEYWKKYSKWWTDRSEQVDSDSE